jgi:hypothetical protein
MQRSLFAAAALFLCALPAAADVHQIGAVNVSADRYTHVSWSRFDGPVVRLRFIADNDNVDCEHVIVTYRDGTSHDVFSGTLARHGAETITFPEGDSRLDNVDFACKAQHLDGARILLSSITDDRDWPEGPDSGVDRTASAHLSADADTEPDGY